MACGSNCPKQNLYAVSPLCRQLVLLSFVLNRRRVASVTCSYKQLRTTQLSHTKQLIDVVLILLVPPTVVTLTRAAILFYRRPKLPSRVMNVFSRGRLVPVV